MENAEAGMKILRFNLSYDMSSSLYSVYELSDISGGWKKREGLLGWVRGYGVRIRSCVWYSV